MNKKRIYEYERGKLEKLKKYQLPHSFKKIGLGIALIAFILFFVRKLAFENLDELRIIAKNGMLVGMLLIVISKEKIEDELISKLRGQAFSFAFIAGVVYALVMPLTNYIVDLVIGSKEASYEEFGDFIILWFMMVVYLAFFQVLKKTR